MSGRELYKIMIKNDLDFVIDKIIEKNNDLTIKELKIEELEKEIERLNNIINELEEIINYEIEKWQNTDDELMKARVQEDKHILDVIQELKDSD